MKLANYEIVGFRVNDTDPIVAGTWSAILAKAKKENLDINGCYDDGSDINAPLQLQEMRVLLHTLEKYT